jgi:hypothetical protein
MSNPTGSIFHTSHCGSTLLAYLLSPFAEVYSEPAWTHGMVKERKSPKALRPEGGVIVKYPSGLCHLIPLVQGPQVFLYRNLGEHLIKLNASNSPMYIDYYYDYCRLYAHPELENLQTNTNLEKHVFLWANRLLWARDNDVLLVKSSKFLSETLPEFNKICSYLNVAQVDKINLPFFNVKGAGYNHQEIQLKEVKPAAAVPVRKNEGVIPEAITNNSDMVKEAREWVFSSLKIDESFL